MSTDETLRFEAGHGTVRGFWWIFGGAWLAYVGLVSSAVALDERSVIPLWMALLTVLSPVVLSIPVALLRRHLLRPDRGLGRTVLLHAAVGIGYAGAATALTTGALAVARVWSDSTALPEGMSAQAMFVNALFLYGILAGFLMWTESLARVQESRLVAAREAMLRAQAEADALMARFNPHFVFNTLHSLMLLIHREPATAERAIEDVAHLIRYAATLQRRGVDLVPLSQEVEVARRYLALEKLRLDERLTVRWEPFEGLDEYGVPPFSLQILLENAVRHGLAPRTDGGTVRVGAVRNGDALVLEVEDDGNGADPDAMPDSDRRGLGLLKQRLEVLFGEGAELEWRTAPGAGFRATIRVPCTPTPPVDMPGREGTPFGKIRTSP